MRVLVVEDDPNLRKLCTFALALDPSVVVATAASGEEALTAIAAERPDIVLLDLELPGMGGRETATRIHPSIPIVVMTGHGRVTVADFAGRVRAVLNKPFDPLTLAASLR